ncbi:BrnA antitoxin family protein [Candidatus Parcubacteria bacterium]|nr:BrnA antitoxin family protein [Patescibacteria group bacterium]MCG2688977.1 BrnA antitoxin family protein [Candidatus Parcubacteria bacterium]
MKKVFKAIPEFKSEKEERDFWLTHDSTEYVDWSKAVRAEFPNLKPSSKTINIRIPENLLNEIKIQANKMDVPYQSYIKFVLIKNHKPAYAEKVMVA